MANAIAFDESRPLDLIPIGRITVDLNPSRENYYKSTSDVTYFMKYLGGSPGNVAVGTRRLGCNVGFIGKLSQDHFGDYIYRYFEKEGIDRSGLSRAEKKYQTGLTFTEIFSKTESSIMMYRYDVADLQLSPEDVSTDYIRSAKAVLISGTALCQSPSREAVLKALAIAKQTKTFVIFDIDYRPYCWKSEDEIAVYYSTVAKEADMIIGSREEFNLTEKFCLPGNTDDRTSADYWFGRNAKAVIIKHGSKGSFGYFADGESYCAKPFPVVLIKSFGGGDGYASAFLTGLFHGLPYSRCLSLGSAEAAMLVASESCADDMPDWNALVKFEQEEIAKFGDMVTKV